MRKTLLVTLGLICIGLGIIGIFIPLLPTTPFLILAAALFAKSSDRLYNWILNHKVFGKYIQSFREEKAIPLHAKIIAMLMLWGLILFNIFFLVNDRWYLQVILALLATGVSFYVLSFKTKKTN